MSAKNNRNEECWSGRREWNLSAECWPISACPLASRTSTKVWHLQQPQPLTALIIRHFDQLMRQTMKKKIPKHGSGPIGMIYTHRIVDSNFASFLPLHAFTSFMSFLLLRLLLTTEIFESFWQSFWFAFLLWPANSVRLHELFFFFCFLLNQKYYMWSQITTNYTAQKAKKTKKKTKKTKNKAKEIGTPLNFHKLLFRRNSAGTSLEKEWTAA